MSEIKRIAEAVRNAINGTVIMQVDEALARIVTNQMEGIVGVELRVATDGVVDGNFISDVLLNNDGSDILRELSLRARARAAIWTDVAVKLDEEARRHPMTQRSTPTVTGGRSTLAQWTRAFGHALAAEWTTIDRDQSAPVMAAVGAAVQHSPWRTALKTAPLAAVIFAATSRTLQRPPATAIKTAGEWCEVALTLNGRLADLVVAGIVRDCVGATPAMMDPQATEELHGC